MNKKFYTLLSLAIVVIAFLANSSGAGTAQGKDRTNSPIAEGTCATCHGGGNYNASTTVELIDNTNAISQYYEPGVSYTIRITANGGGAAGFGFQAVTLDSSNLQAGVLSGGTGHKVLSINNIKYAEHKSLINAETVEIPWTAPAENTGSVNFHYSVLFCDGNGNTSGDKTVVQSAVFEEAQGTNVYDLETNDMNLSITPNPIQNNRLEYQIGNSQDGKYNLAVLDATGKIVMKQVVELNSGKQVKSLDVSHLAKGTYVLSIIGTKYTAKERFLKL